MFVYFTIGKSSQMVARIPTTFETDNKMPTPGEPFELYLDIDNIHYFDRESGNSIIKLKSNAIADTAVG